jgi:beta-glucanase (GH16 family)
MSAPPRRRPRLLAAGALLALGLLAPVQATTGPGAQAATSDACGAVLTKADGTTWTCSFVDDFDGKALDPSKWITQQTSLTGFRSGQTCFTTSDKNIKVLRGELSLTARMERGKFLCKSPSGDFTTIYTGGMIGTRTKFSQAYGRFEVRAKYPDVAVSGVHGGFWMYPLNNTYGAWPASGEIDVAEWFSNDPTLVLPSLHYNGRDASLDSGWGCRVTDPWNYHTYTLDWEPTGISVAIDGTTCFSRVAEPDSPLMWPQPFDKPFSMILNMGVGPGSGSNAVTSATPLPATYVVDYAKAWR